MSKLQFALLLLPLVVFAHVLLLSLLFTGIWEVNAAFGRVPPIPGWDMLGWLKAEIALFACLIVGVLWFAPFAAYLSTPTIRHANSASTALSHLSKIGRAHA